MLTNLSQVVLVLLLLLLLLFILRRIGINTRYFVRHYYDYYCHCYSSITTAPTATTTTTTTTTTLTAAAVASCRHTTAAATTATIDTAVASGKCTQMPIGCLMTDDCALPAACTYFSLISSLLLFYLCGRWSSRQTGTSGPARRSMHGFPPENRLFFTWPNRFCF